MSKSEAVGNIVKVGANTAYQVYVWTDSLGLPKFSFRLGIYWINPSTNLPQVVFGCDLQNYDEQTKGRLVAKKHIERLTEEAALTQPAIQMQVVPQQPQQPAQIPHQQGNPQQQIQHPQSQPQWQQPPLPAQQPQQQSQQQPQPIHPPKPYPSGEGNY